jgi:hypothetical protein
MRSEPLLLWHSRSQPPNCDSFCCTQTIGAVYDDDPITSPDAFFLHVACLCRTDEEPFVHVVDLERIEPLHAAAILVREFKLCSRIVLF